MNLRRTIFGAIAMACLMAMAAPQGVDAQIYNQYTISLVPRFFQPQAGRGVIIPRSSFLDLYSGIVDPDNGVAGPIPIGFRFEYNGQTYTDFYVSVNGWISFRNPLATGGAGYFGDDPTALFNNSRPNLTVAPFFGDHYLRTPGYDVNDPYGRPYTPSYIRYVNHLARDINNNKIGPDTLVVEWENLNINYSFDPNDPNNPFAPIANQKPQATSIATFQVYLIEGDTTGNRCFAPQGNIEFHYNTVGNGGIVKTSGASVGIEDEPAVPGGATTFMNAVAWVQSGFNNDSLILSHRLTTTFPPTGLQSQVFRFTSNCVQRIGTWGDGDADLTQLNPNAPSSVRGDQRLFVTFADVIRILRHQATRNIDFDSTFGRHAFHGDVNHNGRYFYSTRNQANTADSLDINGNPVRSIRYFPTKDINPALPFPNDNSFSGFLFDANQQDAALIMLYLSAKLPQLPWLPDTLPAFTGKLAPNTIASDVKFGQAQSVTGKTVDIPVTFNGMLNGALGVGFEAANGTRVVGVRTMPRTDNAWVEAQNGDGRVAIAAAGVFQPNDVIAVITVEANGNGDVTFNNVNVGDVAKPMRKLSIYNSGATTGDASTLSMWQNFPNPFSSFTTTTLAYNVPVSGAVSVRIYDVLGHEVKTLVDGSLNAGSYSAQWNGTDVAGKAVATGVYYCRLEQNGQIKTVTMQVVR